MTVKTVGKKIKKKAKRITGSEKEREAVVSVKTVKIQVKKTRCEIVIQDIIKMTAKCEKGTEQIEFYTFTALDQCLKRLTGFCPPN
jgi:hypothetical protein|tara:strand:- start:1640 stop:1897 length:258 start_codon:yes stop_codon:yes gene_type:complete